jgi:hypothetical protein
MADEIIEDVMFRNTELAATLTDAVTLLAVAVRRHPNDGWAKRAKELVPDLESHVPCPGEFGFTSCCEYHQHGFSCGDPTDICATCGKTNDEHRMVWEKLT